LATFVSVPLVFGLSLVPSTSGAQSHGFPLSVSYVEPDVARYLAEIARALVLLDASKFEEAVEVTQQVLLEAKKRLGNDHPVTLDALHTLGYVLTEAGEYDRAYEPVSQAAEARARVLGAAHEKTWESQITLAALLGQTLRLRESDKVLSDLLRIQVTTLGVDHPLQAMTFANLASLQLRLGRLNEALVSHRKANALFVTNQSPKSLDSFLLRFNWIHALTLAGQTSEAIAIGEEAFRDCVAFVGERHESCLIILNNLAGAYEAAGQIQAALDKFHRAAELAPSVLGEKHPTSFRLQLNSAFHRAMLGTVQDLDQLRHLVTSKVKIGEDKSTTGLASAHLLATALAAHGFVEESAQVFGQVSTARAIVNGDQHPETIYSATGWAHSLFHMGGRDEAVRLLDQVVDRIEANRSLIGLQGADGQRDWGTAFINPYLSRLEFLIATGQTTRAFRAADEMKARQLLERLRSRAIPLERVLPAETASEIAQLQDALWDLDVELGRTGEPAKRDALRGRRLEMAQRLAQVNAGARALEPRYAALTDHRNSQPSDLQALSAGEGYVAWVLLEGMRIATFTASANGQMKGRVSDPSPGLIDMVEAMRLWSQYMVRTDRQVRDSSDRVIHFARWTDVNGRIRWRATRGEVCSDKQLQDAATAERMAEISHKVGIARRRGVGSHRPGPECAPAGAVTMFGEMGRRELARDLARILFDPVLPELASHRRLLLSPDGPLWMLPWDLIAAEGQLENRPLTLVHNLAAAAHLRRLERSKAGPDKLLAIADPAYAVSGSHSRTRGVHARAALRRRGFAQSEAHTAWPRLPYTRLEAEEVAKLFKRHHALVLTSSHATARAIKDLSSRGDLRRFSHVMLSVHGYFDQALPAGAGLVLAPDSGESTSPSFLTVTDMALLRMNSRLSVLSACNTALGSLQAGEGLVGLSYALQLAGNRRSLVTLWPVADRAAAAFVVDFMRRVRRGIPEAQALAATKRSFKVHRSRELSSPSLWAAFMLHGT
jgi:tetratricopeptide (TPR) repeat protein